MKHKQIKDQHDALYKKLKAQYYAGISGREIGFNLGAYIHWPIITPIYKRLNFYDET